MPTEEEIAAAATAISKLLDQDMPAFFREQVTAEQIAKYATAGLEAVEKLQNKEC